MFLVLQVIFAGIMGIASSKKKTNCTVSGVKGVKLSDRVDEQFMPDCKKTCSKLHVPFPIVTLLGRLIEHVAKFRAPVPKKSHRPHLRSHLILIHQFLIFRLWDFSSCRFWPDCLPYFRWYLV